MKKKITDLTPEEREAQRDKWREEKRHERQEKHRAAYIPTAEEWADEFAATERAKTLDAYVKQFSSKVVEELGRELGGPHKDSMGNVVGYDYDEEFTVDRVARTLLGLKKNWVHEVRSPDGEMVAGLYFADSFGGVVESAHRHGLKQSPVFAASFRDLLEMLNKRYGSQHTDDATAVRAELAGTYVYVPPQPKLVPKSEPKPEPKPDVVTPVAEPKIEQPIPNVNWSQLNKDLDEQARRFLDGIR
jgi:hypothetical protein